jgi:PST family polysaccharide transporter
VGTKENVAAFDGEEKPLNTANAASLTVVAQALKFFLRIGSQIFVARILFPADYGLVAMAGPLLALIGLIGDLGLSQAIIQKKDLTESDVSTMFWVGAGVNVILCAVAAGCSYGLAWIYHEPRIVGITFALLPVTLISSFSAQQGALLIRRLKFGLLAITDVASGAAGLVAALAVALAGFGYWAIIAGMAAESLVTCAVFWYTSKWKISRPHLNAGTMTMLSAGSHITGYNLANFVTTSLDTFLLGVAHGNVALGLYDKGYKLVTQPLGQVIAPFNRITVPILLRLQDDEPKYADTYLFIVKILTLAVTPGIVVLMFAAGPLTLALLGDKWSSLAPVVAWFGVGALGSILYTSTYWLFVSQHRTKEQLKFVFATSAISTVGFVAGLYWGAQGVAAGGGLSFLLVCVPLTCWGATRRGPVTGRALLAALRPFVLPLAVSIGAVELFTMELVSMSPIVSAAGSVVTAYIAFGLGLLLTGDGRALLGRVWKLKGRVLKRGH